MIKISPSTRTVVVFALLTACFAITMLSFASSSLAISQKMAYEGNLYDPAGEPLTGSYNMRFSILKVSGGSSSVIWGPETHTSVTVSRGWFSVILGEKTAIDPSSFDDSPLYLRIEIANPPASSNYELLTPSTAIVSVGSAFRALEATTAITVPDGSITAAKLAPGSVTKEAISTSNSPEANQYLRWYDNSLQWATVSGGGSSAEADNVTIGTNDSGSLEVKDLGISSTKISTSAVTAEKLAGGAVTLESIAAINSPTSGQYLKWSGSQLQWATVSGGTGSVEPDEITITTNVNGSIEVKDGGISADKISSGAITEPKMASGAVTAGAIAAGAVSTDEIASGAVTTPKIANNIEITTSGSISAVSLAGKHYGDGTNLTGITATNVSDYSITSTKIATSAVVADKIAAGSITADAIAAEAITTPKIASDISISTSGKITAEAFYGSGAGLTGIVATTANYAVLSGTATSAATANIANYAAVAGTATTAATATIADTANYAALAGSATSAASANIANYAAVAGTATTAATATIADTANYAALAGSATSAASAVNFSGTLTGDVTGTQGATAITTAAVTADKLASDAAVLSIASQEADRLTGAVDIKAGSNIIISQDGQTIEVSSSAIADIPDFSVTSTKIATSAVTAEKLATGAVTAGAISTENEPAADRYLRWSGTGLDWSAVSGGTGSAEPDNITIRKNAFGSMEVMPLGISSTRIATSAVTADKLALNAAVLSIASQEAARLTGTVDIKPGSNIMITQTGQTIEVSSSAISDIPDFSITSTKIATSAVTAEKIASGAVSNEALAPGDFPNITGVGTLGALAVNGEVVFAPSSVHDISAGSGITSAMLSGKILRVRGSGGPVTVSADPPVAQGQNGQIIILRGSDETDTVTFNPGANLKLSGGYPFTLGNHDALMLCFDGEENLWFELTRSDN